MKLGIRLTISGLVLASIVISATIVHTMWWRVADANSRALAANINQQIVAAVQKELASLVIEARAAHAAIRTLFFQNVLDTREADKREFVFLAQLQSHPALSWIAFGWPDGSFFAAHKLGDKHIEMMEIAIDDGADKRRVDRYQVFTDDIEFENRSFVATNYRVTEQDWFATANRLDSPRWFNISVHPGTVRPAIAYAGPVDVYQKRQGVLAVVIEHTRLARFLSQLAVGKSGAAFILGPPPAIIATPDPEADEIMPAVTSHPLLAVARAALSAASTSTAPDRAINLRQVDAGLAYAVSLTPLALPGWTLATVIPEAEFLGEVEATTRRLLAGSVIVIVAAGLLSAWLARRIIAAPLMRIAAELKHVEQFELQRVKRHPSHLIEIDNLSRNITDMARGLAAFRKYIPADLVKMLVGQIVDPHPGGAVRPMTVMFSDVAGFTGLSERLGDGIIPILSTYLDTMSREVNAHGGTIDKFIGDAVMAFWGAPATNPAHAVDACKAALACQRAIRISELQDDRGRPLKIRIGINSGSMLVGNIGSDVRLNYTVIGDAVNVASRLEATNKDFGSEIIIGEETRRLALRVFELIALADDQPRPRWISGYEVGLAAYRARNFTNAISLFEKVLSVRDDPPTRIMIERCRTLLANPPGDEWEPVLAKQTK
jgi:adenylate cyclase